MRKTSPKPRARSEDLIVTDVQDETLVYDLTKHRAHSLNPTAAVIWRNCDGHHGVPELAALVNSELGLPEDEKSVWLGLSRLQEAELLAEPITPPDYVENSSRRDFMRKVGLVSAAAGAASVVSLVAPLSVAAASCVAKPQGTAGCLNNGLSCTSGNQCCSCVCKEVDGSGFICSAT